LPAEVVARRPLLSNAKAFLALQMGEERDLIAAQQQSDRLVAERRGATMGGMAEEELQVAQAELAVLRGVQHYILGQAAEAIASARSGMEQLPAEALHVRAIALAVIATSLQMEGDMARGARVMREALADPAWPKSLRTRLLHYLSVACVMAGDLSGALEAAHQCLRTAESRRRAEAISYARYDLGVAHYLRYEWAAAERVLCALFEDRAVSAPVYVTFGAFALALIYQAQGRSQEAQRVIDLVSAYLLESEHDAHVMAQAITQAFRVELALRQGKLAQARQLSQGVQFHIYTPRWCFYMPQLTQCKLLLAEGSTASLAAARASLVELDGALDRLQRNHVRIDALALLALAHDALGQQAAALDSLGAALRLAETGGFVHSFVDLGPPMAGLLAKLRSRPEVGRSAGLLVYLDQILAAFAAPALAAAAPSGIPSGGSLVERLTERETEILQLLAAGLSPKEMAGQLVVSLTTVRTHIRNIYAKLGVHSRLEAVQRAGELELL
jgi:LuxR family maltose regulon positive regulatory protein